MEQRQFLQQMVMEQLYVHMLKKKMNIFLHLSQKLTQNGSQT